MIFGDKNSVKKFSKFFAHFTSSIISADIYMYKVRMFLNKLTDDNVFERDKNWHCRSVTCFGQSTLVKLFYLLKMDYLELQIIISLSGYVLRKVMLFFNSASFFKYEIQ